MRRDFSAGFTELLRVQIQPGFTIKGKVRLQRCPDFQFTLGKLQSLQAPHGASPIELAITQWPRGFRVRHGHAFHLSGAAKLNVPTGLLHGHSEDPAQFAFAHITSQPRLPIGKLGWVDIQLERRVRSIQFTALLPTDDQWLFQGAFQKRFFLVIGFQSEGMNLHSPSFGLIGHIIVSLQRIHCRKLHQPMSYLEGR